MVCNGWGNDMLWYYEDGEINVTGDGSDIKYDAEVMNSFTDALCSDMNRYRERAKALEREYVRYHNNETFVGQMAEDSKRFIYEVQGDVLHMKNLELKKEFLNMCLSIDNMFKEEVDPSPKARLSVQTLSKIKKDFNVIYSVVDTKGYELDCHAKEAVDILGRWGVSTVPNFRRAMEALDEFCGHGRLLDKDIKKLENFNQEACALIDRKDLTGYANDLQRNIKHTAGVLDSMTVYQPDVAKRSLGLVGLGAMGVVNNNPVNGFKKLLATNKKSNTATITDYKYIESMKEQYGFSKEDARLLKTAYDNFLKATSEYGLSKKEKIKTFYSYLSALQPQYSSEDFLFSQIADNPSPKKAVEFFNKLGVDGRKLKTSINNQHSSCYENKKRDFAHECAIYSVMAYNNVVKKNSNSIDSVNALVGYKGDVYSGSMGDDDKRADIAAYNIYNRMVECQNEDPWDVMIEYNIGVSEGAINGEKEFLERYGNGDAEIGMKNLIKELDRKSAGTFVVSRNTTSEKIKATRDEFLQYLSDKSGVKIK